jgi:Protein of unknown function (DUF4449)
MFFFKVKRVAVAVYSLKFSIRDSKYDKTFKPLATALVKKQIQKAILFVISLRLQAHVGTGPVFRKTYR